MRPVFICLTLLLFCFCSAGQDKPPVDSPFSTKSLPEITLVGRGSLKDVHQLPEIVGTFIYAGKKNSLIVTANVKGNVAMNCMRQVMAKIPGIHIWESDPSGIQIGIASRGLSPNRSWEFNIRQNGYDIAADPFGYPEAYYNPQLQAVQRIEIVRGQGSLQYGPQFGGMVNYILKNGSEINKPLAFEHQQTFGSNRLMNLFTAVGGQKKKYHYYAFFDNKTGEGWRQNSDFLARSGFGTFTWQLTDKTSLSAELMVFHSRSRQPGGLTDSLIETDAHLSLRGRNWFDIQWLTPALSLNTRFNEHTRWQNKIFATIGNRNSVGFMQSITVKDSINSATLQYNPRTLNEDRYRNIGWESRIITDYHFLSGKHTMATGIRAYHGETARQAEGRGSSGSDYDMSISGRYPRDIRFRSTNAALFFENIFRIGKKLILIPGARLEWLQGSAEGLNNITSSGEEIWLQPVSRKRSFLLGGIGVEYHVNRETEFYGSYAQAYRPIQFANLQAPPLTDIIDPELKDAKGYNIDIGYRGRLLQAVQFDVSLYYLFYGNRIGTLTLANGQRFVTNIGASTSKGLESFVNVSVFKAFGKSGPHDLSVFISYSHNEGYYAGGLKDASIRGKRTENAPADIFRGGLTWMHKNWDCTFQLNHTGSAFSDANNTVKPSANGQSGLIPAYTVSDVSASWVMNPQVILKGGINNLFDVRYFTRRAGGYPGPGALPADGRTFFLTLQAKM